MFSRSTGKVVYPLIPTSNHNFCFHQAEANCVVYPLIPTSNHNWSRWAIVRTMLYILWFLHQTTTHGVQSQANTRCISFDSYIKPQLRTWLNLTMRVVYPLIPTSNHNYSSTAVQVRWLYILWFLHQTTTSSRCVRCLCGCISFDSYIKPQLILHPWQHGGVVYPLIPTSNHNRQASRKTCGSLYILWFLHQTTTYNY